ncbi:unnamed protein product [Dovyalis caffra]|uniref:SET domain-containing protein n=1 Tax=Dovyalis caffra TaxID=77055 RepID=A0AAV1SBT3_9ROSI|nr:unnamed protein product [Dovyalis caffra]
MEQGKWGKTERMKCKREVERRKGHIPFRVHIGRSQAKAKWLDENPKANQTMANEEEAAAAAKLEGFLQWLEVNKVELRGCNVKYCGKSKGFGVFSYNDVSDGVLLVVPLDLAITPMRVLQDPLIGPECRAMFEEEVDDRFLMILFLMLERLRKNSSWKPYLDMLPTTFGNPLWFTDDELLELKGTTLYRATELQALLMSGSKVHGVDGQVNGVPSTPIQGETVWVEGLVPGIDFCNHDLKAVATWEVDGTGLTTGVPHSMYLLSAIPCCSHDIFAHPTRKAEQTPIETKKEITISYGNKGNEELLYLYGFVIDNNPDEYLMVHYPVEAIQKVPFADSKMQLLEAQKAEMRCLLPKRLLAHGFFPAGTASNDSNGKGKAEKICNFSWSGQRRMPSYINKLVFPEEFLTALRTIAMQEDELFKVSSLLEEVSSFMTGDRTWSEGVRQPTDTEVRTAVWEACGDSGALQLLFDLIQTKMMDLEENSGTEDCDTELLEKSQDVKNIEQCESPEADGSGHYKFMSRNRWSSIVYRKGQKQLTRLFLKEAEHALQLSLGEGE